MEFFDVVNRVAPDVLPLASRVLYLDRLVTTTLLRTDPIEWYRNQAKQDVYLLLLSHCSFFYFSSQNRDFDGSIFDQVRRTQIENWLALESLDLMTIEVDLVEQHCALQNHPEPYEAFLKDYLQRVRPCLWAIVVKAHHLENQFFDGSLKADSYATNYVIGS